VTYPKAPRRTRQVARFLAEAYQGKRLLDVVPFNFPLLAPAESFTPTGAEIASRMEANLVTAAEVEVPWLGAIDRVLIRDVATGRLWPLDLSPLRPKEAAKDGPARADPRPQGPRARGAASAPQPPGARGAAPERRAPAGGKR
jgi:hypothetical protein